MHRHAHIPDVLSFQRRSPSLNAAVLGPDVQPGSATWDIFVSDVARDMTQKAGQKCTAVRRIFASADHLAQAQEALVDRLSQVRPEGVLLDLMLPNVSGADLLKKIRATAGFENLPVIGFTNAFVPGMVEQMKAAGAYQVFDKATLTPRVLTAAFQSALRAKG